MNFTPRKAETDATTGIFFPEVSHCMATDEVTLHPDLTINKAIDILLNNKVTGVPVLDDHRVIVGWISEKDCLRIILDSAYNNLPYQDKTVADYMSHVVKTVSINSDILDVANEFLTTSYRKFPVINDEGQLVGQVSRRDILKAVRNIKNTTW